MKFLYAISSHIKYREPLGRLFWSMSTIPSARKFAVVGGSKRGCYMGLIENAISIEVDHNSFDYTALIYLIESNPIGFTHVFLLHDTMELTPATDALIAAADPTMDAVAAFPGGQCNLCLFRTDYLLANRERILAMRNCTKHQAVAFEGALFKDAPRQALFPNATVTVEAERVVYTDGAVRRVEFYHAIATRKFKASWGQTIEQMHERVKP